MTRAAIYARFSTDLQNERSIEDQVALCRAYAKREGLEVEAMYEDRARSGGSLFGRDGVASLMRHAAERRFEVVIVEALDRLSRDMEDLAGIYKRLSFAEVQLRAVHEGAVDELLVGMRGLFGQYFRKDLKDKIRRGMAGRVRDGQVQAGLAYGYAAVPGKTGARTIVEAEAAIVRRIFEEFAEGVPAREIARRLNADGIPAPRGGSWNQTTINGNGKRSVGILLNELYVGRFVWGRTRKIQSPDTGRDLIRPGASDAKVAAEIPELAIVPRELFDRVTARKHALARVHPSHQRRRKHLLTGLLRCGGCGSGLTVRTTHRDGRKRVDCARQHESRDCPSPHSFMLPTIERAVLSGLQAELRKPDMLAEFARAYRDERKRLAATAGTRRQDMEREAAETQRKLDRVIACIVEGHGDAAVLGPQSTALHRQLERIRTELAALEEIPTVIELNAPGLARYLAHVDDLAGHLCGDAQAVQSKAADAVRGLIETVTVWPGEALATVRVRITGRLAALMNAYVCAGIDGAGSGNRTRAFSLGS
jgi:site-specific DNA recombinase